ncbi:MAG: SAM-dependent methyltransferase [Thermoflexales bacterium]|nr:SAM-dependent methyltransferase [Thermoflexales bacterium]
MEKQAAKTAWGPTTHVALEQLTPTEQRIIHDAAAYQLLPVTLKGLVTLFRIEPLRRLLFKLVESKAPGLRAGILCRKRYIDDKLQEALKAGIQTVVILGAGFDTRAYRLPGLAACQVYEVDLPQNVEAKKQAVRRLLGQVPAHVKLVGMDFDSQDLGEMLCSASYSEQQPAFFIWEGVTQYIPAASVHKVLAFLSRAAASSQLVFSYIRQDFIEGKHLYGQALLHARAVKSRLWQFGLAPEAVAAFLAAYGWKELEQAGSAEYQARYLEPANRVLEVMEVERIVHAEKGV